MSIEDGGTVESIFVFDMEKEWTCIVEIWLDEESSETLLAVGLWNLAWYV